MPYNLLEDCFHVERGFNPLLRTRSRVLMIPELATGTTNSYPSTPLSRKDPMVSRMGQMALHSPLLSQSLLLSLPPPTDMLKLGRFLCTPSGHELDVSMQSIIPKAHLYILLQSRLSFTFPNERFTDSQGTR